jgi:hypothetical protein
MEWNGRNELKLDPVTVRVIEAGLKRARALRIEGQKAR